jgi:aerobic carbon-monoxide dehydrogenase large subunit
MELAAAADGELAAVGTARLPKGHLLDRATGNQVGPTEFMDAAHACDLAVHPRTGEVRILRYLAVHDVGRMFDPEIVRGQITGGIIMGISQVLSENLQLRDGVVHANTLRSYLIPTPLDVPALLELELLESGTGQGPQGARGVGEVGTVAAPSAVAAALADALSIPIDSIPQTPIDLVAALAKGDDQNARGSARNPLAI